MHKIVLILVVFCLPSLGFGQTNDLEKGRIYKALPVENSSDTYALYLPNSYNAKALSAIVFIFDPGGRGAIGIQGFVEAAEKYGYILVCSNATKNGVPYDTNFEKTNLLFDTIFKSFIIDEKQIYTAGFSGGSRLASAIAALTNKIQGVIACGAGLSVNKAFKPSTEMFSFIGLVGDEDMNYLEMLNTKQWLDNYTIDNEILIYSDNHRWPPKTQIDRAFGWLQLQAYKRKIRAVDTLLVRKLYIRQFGIADSLQQRGMLFRSVLEFESIAHNFDAYYNVDSIKSRISDIKTSSAYSDELVNREKIKNDENHLFAKFAKVYGEDIKTGMSPDDFEWWKHEIKAIDDSIRANINVETVKMYKRLRYSLFAGAIESSRAFVRTKKYKQALYCDKLLTFYNSDEAYWYYRLAKSYARLDQFKESVNAMEQAIKLGFNRIDIERTQEFQKFKTKRKFIKLLKAE